MPRGAPVTRIAIVDDHELFAESLKTVLTLERHDVELVPVRGLTNERLLGGIRRRRPQLVLLDLCLGKAGDGLQLIKPLRAAGIAVVVVTATADRARLGEAVLRGAQAVVSKSASLNQVLARIRLVATGQPVMSRSEREDIIRYARQHHQKLRDARSRLETLSRREMEVLAALMRGHTASEIAHAAVVSEATVRSQIKAILRKLDVSSQLAAVALALRARWPLDSP